MKQQLEELLTRIRALQEDVEEVYRQAWIDLERQKVRRAYEALRAPVDKE